MPEWTQRLGDPLLANAAELGELEVWDCKGFDPKPATQPKQWVHTGTKGFKPMEWAKAVGCPTVGSSDMGKSWAEVETEKVDEEMVRKRRRLLQAICASMAVMLIELVGGSIAHSLAIVSDATHMLADVAGYCIALVSVQAAMPKSGEASAMFDGCGPQDAVRRRLRERASFGLHRVPVLGGLGSVLVIWFAAGVLLYEGVSRVSTTLSTGQPPVAIDGAAMVAVATLGLIFNGAIFLLFQDVAHGHGGGAQTHHGHSHGPVADVTTRAALVHPLVHAVGDMVQSAGMLLTAVLIALGGERWELLDALVTCGCSLYMLGGTLSLLHEIFFVLIEAAPPTLDARAVRAALRERPEVLRVSDFHLWALAPGKVMLSAIVLTTPTCDDTDDVLVDLQKVCAYRFDLHHCTFQVTKDPKLA